jgi:hypothetical protein
MARADVAPQGSPVATAATGESLTLHGIGKGVVAIDGAWQFHTGDDPAWAQPRYDDHAWRSITAEDPWGAQGYPAYAGIAWYRRHIEILPTAGASSKYRILIPHIEDAYEVYWNGELIGSYGQLPPHPQWYYGLFPRSFALPEPSKGVLAIRVWKAPLDAFSGAEVGGIYVPPLIGDAPSIRLRLDAITWSYVREDLFDYSLILLRTFIAALCLLLWSKNRKEQLFIWVAVLTSAPVALEILQRLFLIPFSYGLARCLNQPIYVLWHVSLWFLLLSLLRLDENRRLVQWTKRLGIFTLSAGALDGLLALFWAYARAWMQWADGILAALILVVEVFPFLIIALGFRRRLDASRWAVALSALVLQLIDTVADVSALGQRFTHWTLFSEIIDTPLFVIQGVEFRAEKVTSLALFISIIYAVYQYTIEQQARRNALEQEMQSAREIQQVLIPDTLPSLEGYAVTSAYQPALEVGGDFFQILPKSDGSTLVALGDVSGKGLKAAMNVSMIVGVLRALADTSASPAEILGGLNRCLAGRMHGGFATGVLLRLDQDSTVTIANAGHLPPFLNDGEVSVEGSLPLGLVSFAIYEDQTIQMRPGDHLSLFTDGLLEARSESGELYGFERMHALLSTGPTAQQAMEAAIAFGQDDDITVLTLTRLEAGEESTTSMMAPFLAEA